ncbi:MAG: hypothetical protein GY792_25655 [Gammaproteobacteria bacterium]|nr:hypothetical protein [Gammaproteobacteria bacterium]
MPNSRLSLYTIFAIGLLTASSAQAHTGTLHGGELLSGLLHPLLGWDHLLSILLIGIWSVQQRNYPKILISTMFMAAIAIGVLAVQTVGFLPLSGFFASGALVILGLLLAFSVSTPAYMNVLIAAAVGLSQGYAHASMIPSYASSFEFGLGLLVGSTAMFVTGAAMSRSLWNASTAPLFRCGAGSVAVTGLLMWI